MACNFMGIIDQPFLAVISSLFTSNGSASGICAVE